MKLLDDVLALLATVKLHDDTLVNGLALSAEARRKLEGKLLLLRQATQRLSKRLEQLYGAATCLDVVVVIVALLLNAVETFLVQVLLVGDEAGIFTGPGWVGSPLVVQYGVAEFISAAASFLTLLQLRKKQTVSLQFSINKNNI